MLMTRTEMARTSTLLDRIARRLDRQNRACSPEAIDRLRRKLFGVLPEDIAEARTAAQNSRPSASIRG